MVFLDFLKNHKVKNGILHEFFSFIKCRIFALSDFRTGYFFYVLICRSGMIAESLYLSLKSRNIRQQKSNYAIIV